jgi:hypothetical protein
MNPKEVAAEIAKSPVLLAAFREIATALPQPLQPWELPFWSVTGLGLTVGVLLKPTTPEQLALVAFPDGVVFFGESAAAALERARRFILDPERLLRTRAAPPRPLGELKLGEELSGPPPGTWAIGPR